MRIPNVRYSLKDRESLDRALRKFRKMCERENIFRDACALNHFESPSERARRKALKASKSRAKAARIEAAKAERRRGLTARKKLGHVAGAVALPNSRGVAGASLGAPSPPECEAGE